MSKWFLIVLLLVLYWTPNNVQATLIGDTITATWRIENCPTCTPTTGIFDSASATVQAGIVEFLDFVNLDIDVEENTISTRLTGLVVGTGIEAGDFNGLSLTSLDATAGGIVGLSFITDIPVTCPPI